MTSSPHAVLGGQGQYTKELELILRWPLVLLRNILLARQPLYAVPHWLQGFVPELFDLTPEQLPCFNDDRIGRHLDLLFAAPQAALVTDIVLQAIRAFHVDLSQFHQDTTTVTFAGNYAGSTPGGAAPHITFGYNKDHRPDLKQLLWSLVISADGAVPVHFHLHPAALSVTFSLSTRERAISDEASPEDTAGGSGGRRPALGAR